MARTNNGTERGMYDAEFWEVIKPFAGIKQPVTEDPLVFRKGADALLSTRLQSLPATEGVTETTYTITSLDGAQITLHRFQPPETHQQQQASVEPQRAAIFVHGGGMIAGSIPVFRPMIARNAALFGLQLFAVEYRLAPEHPAPAAVQDVFACLRWVQARAGELGVDPARVALWGGSAGGGIALGVALYARDLEREGKREEEGLAFGIARLVLLYPMLDDRTVLSEDDPLHEYLGWTAQQNELGWRAYLGGRGREGGGDDVSIYAAPGRAEDVSGLPRTYIDVGGLDLFRGEVVDLVGRLVRANVEVEFHLYPGVIHGWEGIAPLIRASRDAIANRARVARDF